MPKEKRIPSDNSRLNSFVEVVHTQADRNDDLITFLDDQLNEASKLSYQTLDTKARAIAATLQYQAKQGDRALLLFAPGTDYIACFMGCLYAGIYAVPAYPPQSPREFAPVWAKPNGHPLTR